MESLRRLGRLVEGTFAVLETLGFLLVVLLVLIGDREADDPKARTVAILLPVGAAALLAATALLADRGVYSWWWWLAGAAAGLAIGFVKARLDAARRDMHSAAAR